MAFEVSRKPKLLITGVSGLLGGNAFWEFMDEYEIYGTFHQNPPSFQHKNLFKVDLTDRLSTETLLKQIAPDIILHCAALTNVDLCEKDQDMAIRNNVVATENIVRSAGEACKKFIYISTDAVYPGIEGNYREDSPISPPNFYGQSKLMGEEILRKFEGEHLILRTNIHGINTLSKQSFSESIFQRLKNGQEMHLFSDVCFSPILVNDLCENIRDLLTAGADGIFNVGAHSPVTKLAFGQVLARFINTDAAIIIPILLKERQLLAPRPLHPGLCVAKIETFLNRQMPSAESGIERFLKLLKTDFYQKLKGTT